MGECGEWVHSHSRFWPVHEVGVMSAFASGPLYLQEKGPHYQLLGTGGAPEPQNLSRDF